MIRRNILLAIAAMAAASLAAMRALAWDAGRPNDWVLFAGSVVKVDTEAGKITIQHRQVRAQHMESATMIFRVSDPAMLVNLAVGDKIRFKIERDNKGPVITRIENSN
jgi:Cu(I)/Ag(I) efflux system periplasmic protein CusF